VSRSPPPRACRNDARYPDPGLARHQKAPQPLVTQRDQHRRLVNHPSSHLLCRDHGRPVPWPGGHV